MGIITSYITYRGKAKTRHGVHPPFVYRFIDEVLYAKGARLNDEIESLRKKAETNATKLQLEDYGAGSRLAMPGSPTISQIAKRSASPIALSQLLQRIVDYYHYQNILEFGTNLGLTTAYLAAADTQPKLISMEADHTLHSIAEEHLRTLGLSADLRLGVFDHLFNPALEELTPLDMAYIDGNHQFEPTIKYTQACLKSLQTHGVIVVGDIHWSPQMEAAWQAIKTMPEVRTTIDIFHAGLIWINPDLTPEHFTIKFP